MMKIIIQTCRNPKKVLALKGKTFKINGKKVMIVDVQKELKDG
jgi:hypothetical protein